MRQTGFLSSPSINGRLYHCLPDGFAATRYDGLPRLGLAFALNNKTALPSGFGTFLNRNQISSSAAFGGQPPLMEQQTVINDLVDSPTGAARRNFPLTVFAQDPVGAANNNPRAARSAW